MQRLRVAGEGPLNVMDGNGIWELKYADVAGFGFRV